ncbi:MAG: AMP-binding protein [Acidimicrobiia bacterium]|nr:AMP-binding protein [Acidimicrobiia bacterium]
MHELVAIDVEGGPAFVDALRRAWDDGDAVLPVDQRLPPPARKSLLAVARPHAIVIGDGGGGGSTLDRQPHDRTAPPMADGDALVVASSGTTGPPKLIVHTRAAVEAHARAVHGHLAVDPHRDRWLACLPLAHVGGLGVVLRAVVTDTPLDVWPGFDAARVAAAPDDLGTTLVSLVPTALDRLEASRFRWVVLGGSADSVARPGNVVHTYGLTETGGGVVYEGEPLPSVEVRIGTGDSIFLRGPMLARGVRGPDGAVRSITDDDGWLATGDLGRQGADGHLVVSGRADDLIVTGGENVWPEQVEAVLSVHPWVAEVAVIGRADPEWGQRVVAVVVPVDQAAPPSLEDLRDQVRTVLPAYAAPRELVVVDHLPRTGLGKIRRHRLGI